LPVPGGPYSSKCGNLLLETNLSTGVTKGMAYIEHQKVRGSLAQGPAREKSREGDSQEDRPAQDISTRCCQHRNAKDSIRFPARRAARRHLHTLCNLRVETMSVWAITSPRVSGRYFSTHGVESFATAGRSPTCPLAAAGCSVSISTSAMTGCGFFGASLTY
jgi:hypothetical protein